MIIPEGPFAEGAELLDAVSTGGREGGPGGGALEGDAAGRGGERGWPPEAPAEEGGGAATAPGPAPAEEEEGAPRRATEAARLFFEEQPEYQVHWATRLFYAQQREYEQWLRIKQRKTALQQQRAGAPAGKEDERPGGEPFWHMDPERPIVFGTMMGASRAPVVFLQSSSERVTSYLRSDPLGCFAGGIVEWTYNSEWDWQTWGFAEDKENVLKADWHAIPSATDEADIFVPRMARVRRMRRAPPRIEAFAEAFRAVNREVWSIIVDTLYQTGSRVAHEVAEAIAQDHCHFGSIEAQVRWGRGSLQLPSHIDGATSLLHLGLTLGGERKIRSGVFATPHERARCETEVWEESLWNEENLREVTLMPGMAYLSSPFCFEHGVLYAQTCSYDPVIALQFRLAFKGRLGPELNNMRTDSGMRYVTELIAGVLKVAAEGGWIRMPHIDEVKSAEARLIRMRRLRQKGLLPELQPPPREEKKG